MDILRDIKRTIEYAKRFGCTISPGELKQRLISSKIYSAKEISEVIKKIVLKDNNNEFRQRKIEKAKILASKIEKIFKDILFLGITGSVAAGYPKKNDDIDLILITKKNKLWLTRFKLRLYVFIKKIPHRKYGQKENRNEFCFNLWLDERELTLEKDQQNLKNATDLIMMIPIINRKNVYERFLLANEWTKKYLATGFFNRTKDLKIEKNNLKIKERHLDKTINKLFFWPQYWYMRRKIRKEKIGLHRAFFHP